MKPKIKIFISCLMLGLVLANFASAALVNCGGRGETGTQPECGIGDLFLTVIRIIDFLLSWAWLVTIIFIVWAGWGMVTAGGNEEKISIAKSILSNAIIGFFLVMIAFVLLNFIVSILTGSGVPRAGALIDAFNLLHP